MAINNGDSKLKKKKTVRVKGSREVKDIQKENNEGVKKRVLQSECIKRRNVHLSFSKFEVREGDIYHFIFLL